VVELRLQEYAQRDVISETIWSLRHQNYFSIYTCKSKKVWIKLKALFIIYNKKVSLKKQKKAKQKLRIPTQIGEMRLSQKYIVLAKCRIFEN
jgi:hypothetical protein